MSAPVATDDPFDAVSGPLWWGGWHPLRTTAIGGVAGIALGNVLAVPLHALLGLDAPLTIGGLTVVGAAVGAVVWFRGTRTINGGYQAVLAALRRGLRVPDGSTMYTLVHGARGTTPLIEPRRRLDATFLRLGPAGVEVAEGTFDLAAREPDVDEGDPRAIPYASIESAAWDDGAIALRIDDGERLRYAAAAEPTELLDDLHRRLEAHG